MSIVEQLQNGKKYSFSSEMFEPQYHHSERVKVEIYWKAEEQVFVRSYSYFLQTNSGITQKDTEETHTVEQLAAELETVSPDFWGQGFWTSDHIIDSQEKIQKFIS